MQRSAPPPPVPAEEAPSQAAGKPEKLEEGGLFGIKLPELPEMKLPELPDLGAAIGMENKHETKLRKLEDSRKQAGAIDDDGAWLL